jgi:hypothetical protein
MLVVGRTALSCRCCPLPLAGYLWLLCKIAALPPWLFALEDN